jgi:hypothetical protein
MQQQSFNFSDLPYDESTQLVQRLAFYRLPHIVVFNIDKVLWRISAVKGT